MKRRTFIKGAVAAAVSAALPGGDGVSLQSMAHPAGFGLAPLKAEGASIPYDLNEENLEMMSIRYARALSKSLLQTREVVTRNVLERAFGPMDSGEGARRSTGGGGSPGRV